VHELKTLAWAMRKDAVSCCATIEFAENGAARVSRWPMCVCEMVLHTSRSSMKQDEWAHAMVRAMFFKRQMECAAVRVRVLAVGVAYFTMAVS
jgi:hypothetical protein